VVKNKTTKMKKYFAKNIASDAEIQVGDTITSELGTFYCNKISERKNRPGQFVHCVGLSGSHPISNWKKVQLHLCCTEILPGDSFVYQQSEENHKHFTAGDSKENNQTWILAQEDGWLYHRSRCFSVFGAFTKNTPLQEDQEVQESDLLLGPNKKELQCTPRNQWKTQEVSIKVK
jgi:hypothetical protein